MSKLPDAIKQQIQDGYRQFLAQGGLKPRLGQRQMIAVIANALSAIEESGVNPPEPGSTSSGICVVEAGTGTGKTIAYLLAALPLAEHLGKQVVIATGTIALQEQLLNKDIPALIASTGWNYSFLMAKGRGRYLCPLRLDQCLATIDAKQGGEFLFEDELTFNPDKRVIKTYQSMATSLEKGDWDGDRDHWEAIISDADWQPLTIDRRQCVGRRCRFIRECCFFNARDQLEDADCLVVNHDLLMADLAVGGGVILPAPDKSIYVVDEAHRLPDKAINHFTANARMAGTLNWLRKLERQLQTITQQSAAEAELMRHLDRLVDPVAKVIDAVSLVQPLLMAQLEESDQGSKTRHRFVNGDIGVGLRRQASDIAAAFGLLVTRLQAVTDTLQNSLSVAHPATPLVDLENALQLVGTWQNRAESALELWDYFSQPVSETGPQMARWLTFDESAIGDSDLQLFASPTYGGHILRERLFDCCAGAVLTSATLRMLNRFDDFIKRVGLPENVACHAVSGVFNYPQAAVLSVPDIGADGSDPLEHTRALIDKLPGMLDSDRGTLVLFSSKRQMQDVVAGVENAISGQLLVQNDLPLIQLLSKHKEAVDAGRGSVIFGLASFAEGIDLPGDYCTHVIIAKLPFSVPDDPVTATLSDWLEKSGGNPFMQLALPEASLKLNQACGRLLRTEQDSGKITVLDRRLLTKRYGAALLNALPPFRRE